MNRVVQIGYWVPNTVTGISEPFSEVLKTWVFDWSDHSADYEIQDNIKRQFEWRREISQYFVSQKRRWTSVKELFLCSVPNFPNLCCFLTMSLILSTSFFPQFVPYALLFAPLLPLSLITWDRDNIQSSSGVLFFAPYACPLLQVINLWRR